MKIAFVYDWFDKVGGAERILTVLHEMYPDAPWYTSYRDEYRASWAQGWDVRTSFIQKLPRFVRGHRLLTLPLLPLAFESFDFSSYDVVVSVTSSFAKYIITKPTTRHICYLLTPTRWLWHDDYGRVRTVHEMLRGYFKQLDLIASARANEYLTISHEVQERCLAIYGRQGEVVYPPFDEMYWHQLLSKKSTNASSSKYYLVVSRLEPYKRIDMVIDAWKGREDRLVIIGSGSQEQQLRIQAKGIRIEFYSHLSDADLATWYAGAQALIMPQVEDFGYTALEAQACGCPVVAYDRGGARETVYYGVLFEEQTPTSLRRALVKCANLQYNPDTYENRHIRGGSWNTFVAAFSQKISKTV
jgi:glycosyltransferase involved in cell wall biosynthesis